MDDDDVLWHGFFSPCVTAIALIWLEVMAKNNEMSGFVSCRVTHGEQVGE
jgi:hypothetical protein